MKHKLERMGVTSEHLDTIVLDTATDMASNANNEGLSGQLDFLATAGVSDERLWARLITEHLRPGMAVDVGEPRYEDSPHTCDFSGVVADMFDDGVLVRDQDDNTYHIAFSEIANFHIAQQPSQSA